jgi:O-antigen/teichoic acid export membrane protein
MFDNPGRRPPGQKPSSHPMKSRSLAVNAGAAVGQVVVTAGVLFLVYGFVIRSIGASQFGVWAMVGASASIASIGNLGLSAGAVKFIAKHRALNDPARVSGVLSTTLLSVGVALGVISALGLWALPLGLRYVIRDPEEYRLAMQILPYSIASFWIGSLATVGVSGLDGFNRIDLRSMASVGSMLAYSGLVLILVPRRGLVGMVEAQIGQGAVLLTVSWLLLRRESGNLPWLPYRWDLNIFREIIGYGANFQAISIGQILWEPASKAILTSIGGATATGIFEMANRLAFQVRNLADAAHRTLVPTIAEFKETQPERVHDVHRASARLMVLASAMGFPLLVLSLPVVSRVWIGEVNSDFVAFGSMVAASWMLNLLATPAYYANTGTGDLTWNVLGTYITAATNIVLGIALGRLWGAEGVVAGVALSLVVGGLATVLEHRHRNGYGWSEFFPREDRAFLISASVFSTVAILFSILGVPLAWSLAGFVVALPALLVPAYSQSGALSVKSALRAFSSRKS